MYVIGGVFDGIPQDPDHPRSWRFDLAEDDGALLIAEGGYEANDGKNKLAVGAWGYTEETADIDGTGESNSKGAYVLTSYQVYNNEAKNRDLTAFFRFGMATEDTLQTDWSYQAGIVGTGWVSCRPEGEIGVGFTQAHNGDDYQTAAAPTDNSEHGFEIYYRDLITPAIAIQPDLQYVVNPGTDTTTDDALVAGIRLNVNF
jgi:porin